MYTIKIIVKYIYVFMEQTCAGGEVPLFYFNNLMQTANIMLFKTNCSRPRLKQMIILRDFRHRQNIAAIHFKNEFILERQPLCKRT
jgi:hypothetical protein